MIDNLAMKFGLLDSYHTFLQIV